MDSACRRKWQFDENQGDGGTGMALQFCGARPLPSPSPTGPLMPRQHARPILLPALISAALLSAAFAPQAAAVEPGRPPAVEGWLQLPPRNGMMTFRCQSAACGGSGAVLTIFRHHEVLANMTAEMFMRLQEENNVSDNAANPGAKSVVSLRSVTSLDGINVFSAWQERTQPNGDKLFVVTSLIPGPAATVTVVAMARTREQVSANFDAFLPQLPALTH
ncbi:hypothetical protein [Xanthobacter sp. NFH-94]|uniref:hypothetical protein n=2 Tax=Xanthobacter TaxID=279 RepID=UPI001F17D461|nr:hypothetical protein [Xanthobacter sp. NFH-94]